MYATTPFCTGPVNNTTGPLLPQGSGLGCMGCDCGCGGKCSKGLGDVSMTDVVMYGAIGVLVLMLLPAAFSKPGRRPS